MKSPLNQQSQQSIDQQTKTSVKSIKSGQAINIRPPTSNTQNVNTQLNNDKKQQKDLNKNKKKKKNQKEKDKDKKKKEKQKGKNQQKEKKQIHDQAEEQFNELDEEKLGYIRDELEDDEWIQKLTNDENNLQENHDKIPSPIVVKNYVNMIFALFVVIALNIVHIVIVVVYVGQYQQIPSNVVLSGIRPATLAQIQYLLLRAIMNYQCVSTLHHINLPATSQPMWKDDSHVSSDRKVIL
ncbi:MAG: hypothetical protein EZS28_040446, partial [Streblomastix strix]